ncbi:monooxygenase [Purpureocillium lavendulum]|uniref:Monooxygenase n=1 Tax=Purpureocillium lavendulum TaxID=1247861 RepID=A0AB34FR26_9HYPO|nr:monooxygenase [Purpureocillium lavendulum]
MEATRLSASMTQDGKQAAARDEDSNAAMTAKDEKHAVAHNEDPDAARESIDKGESGRHVHGMHDAKYERRVLRKIDWRLLPILGCLYTIALVDRSNVAVARIAGMDEDLGLAEGSRASIILMVFFIGYVLFQIPSNALIHRIGAANWLAFFAVTWGLATLVIGFLQNWQGLAALRALLGVFEAGFFPGCVYLVSSWYARYEVQKRMAGFFMTASALSAFANILAYGIIQIANHHSYKGWRWIYILEGAVTVVAGVGSWFVIVDFPDSDANTFLTPEEKEFVRARLEADRGPEVRESVTVKIVLKTAADWKPWAFSLMYMAGAIGVYAFLFFLPLILRGGLGYSLSMSFILSTPPSLFSVVEAMLISWFADKVKLRGPFVVFQGLVGIVGLCMTAFLDAPTPRYIGTFLGVAGANGLVVTALAWQSNNIVGDARRAVSTAILISMSGVGGIYSSMVFRQQDAPNYLPGIIAVMAINIAAVVTAILTMVLLRVQNRRADQGRALCEGREGFRYTL